LIFQDQFSLIVSFAMTINESLRLATKNVSVYLPSPVFSYGQLYAAISRVTASGGLKILINDEDGENTNVTSNVVYKKVL